MIYNFFFTNTNTNIFGLTKRANTNMNLFGLNKRADKKRGIRMQIQIFGLVFSNTNTNTNICHTLVWYAVKQILYNVGHFLIKTTIKKGGPNLTN